MGLLNRIRSLLSMGERRIEPDRATVEELVRALSGFRQEDPRATRLKELRAKVEEELRRGDGGSAG
jgi:hypothetical protein